MSALTNHAAWALTGAFVLAFVYELYRATAKAGTSRHDSMRVFIQQGLVTYAVAALIIAALFLGLGWAPALAFLFSAAIILVSIFYYNPRIVIERRPSLIDWIEDLVFTGLLFVAATLLLYELAGWRLERTIG